MPDLGKVIRGLEKCKTAPELKEECAGCPYDDGQDDCIARMAADALALLKAQDVPETNVGEWISVKDRLSENDDKVLCCTRTAKGIQNIIIGYYMGGMWRCGMNSNVTHWMPLPEPPKEE